MLQHDKKEIYCSISSEDMEYTWMQPIKTLIYICLDELMDIPIKALILVFDKATLHVSRRPGER